MTKRMLLAVVVTALAAVPGAQAKAPRCNKQGAHGRRERDGPCVRHRQGWAEHTGSVGMPARQKKKATFLFDGASNETWSALRIAGDRYVSVVGPLRVDVRRAGRHHVARADIVKRKHSDWRVPDEGNVPPIRTSLCSTTAAPP